VEQLDCGSNCEKMANNARCDGLTLLWRDVDPEQISQRLNFVRDALRNALGLEWAEVNKGFKHKMLRSGGESGGSLYRVQLTGECAAIIDYLPWWMVRTATKLHMKTFADEAFVGAADSFAEQVFNSEGMLQASFFANAKNNRSPKNSGTKGTRLGSRKSDHQAVIYGRARERVGIEARVEDKTLVRIVNEVDRMGDAIKTPITDQDKAASLQLRAARAGFAKLLKECRQRGVNIANYFLFVTRYHQGAVDEGQGDRLSHQEEASYIPSIT
jgi:hypothetical protein